ncbi:hypothetical protein B0H67DRAFT_681538 [Lasiosphaeris hirsuta]|uniref:Uncharacterized protein n=1 Tax=Lasiosphaeris hirsuta TaxID=260670 RepID=A0AA40E054_9PEZI|nr:hypothetical protein B0H67DRAFT_681538 [Lasiosphaeris hirsuta]
MSDQELVPDFNEADFVWEDHTSALGKPYKVGHPKGEDGATTASNSADTGGNAKSDVAEDDGPKPPGWVPWTVPEDYRNGQDVFWKAPPVGFQTTSSGDVSDPVLVGGITSWWIRSETVGWSLHIKSNKRYKYRFRDETNDWYELRVFMTSKEHFVGYTSSKPNINRVEFYEPIF